MSLKPTITGRPPSIVSDELSALCRKHHVQELSLFGSHARGEARPDSDIDLLVEFEPSARVRFIAFSQLMHDLTNLLRRKVDLVSKPGLHPLIRDRVLAESEVLFAA